ncbi:MAG: glycoside hydrolase family 32 protein [Pirellulales bacterium]
MHVAGPLFRIATMLLLLGGTALAQLTSDAQRADVVIADFESGNYGMWKVEGEAFGPAPAEGTLPGQMQVTGFQGERLVSSFYKGDDSTGTLTSPPLTIDRPFINFLIGGGGYPGETCINLLSQGRVVRTATGPNRAAGGSEALDWHTWDVRDLAGKAVVIEIVDARTGGWGHINVDQIVLSDRSRMVPPEELSRTIAIEKRYLNLPIKNGAPMRRMELTVGGETERAFDIELAPDEADWWAFIDVSAFRGDQAELKTNALAQGSGGLKAIFQSDRIHNAENLYAERLRPQFHFSQRRGWNNDPNGMVYYDGEWHLFFQHNPYGWNWGNMHWGHAVSRDLVHWEELPIALYPWTMAQEHCFSGTAVVDKENTSGFQTGDEEVLVAAFTDTGRGEAIAYSNDRGRTWTYWQGNPVIEHQGRDPKVFWHEPTQHWVMALYDEHQGKQWIAFYNSPDLKVWEFQSRLEGYFECPEIFELPIDGDEDSTRWVVFAADAKYALGQFDGRAFTPDHEGKHQLHWGAYYASQTYNNTPDDRRIQIGWGRIDMEGMPFNQMMTFPCELTLRSTGDGTRLFARPVREIERLRKKTYLRENVVLQPGDPLEVPVTGELFDIRAEFDVGEAAALRITVGDRTITYNAAEQTLEGMPLKPVGGRVQIQLLIDRPSLEICGNDGRVYQTSSFRADSPIEAIRFSSRGGESRLLKLEVHELRSIWQ